MSLFSFILQKSIESSDQTYVEVKGKIANNILDKKFSSVSIKSDADVKLTYGNKFLIKVFAVNPKEADFIQINCKVSDECLSINVLSKKENLKIYIKISIPDKVDSLTVNTKYSDISSKQVNAGLMKLISLNGDINVSGGNFSECIAQTDSGDIHIHLNSGTYKIKATSKTGDIILRNVKSNSASKNSIKCSSKSGDIVITK